MNRHQRRLDVGWSLVIAIAVNILFGLIATAVGDQPTAALAATVLAVLSCVLVAAETLGRLGRTDYDTIPREGTTQDDYLRDNY